MLGKILIFTLAMGAALYVGWLMIRWSSVVKLDERSRDEHQDSWRDR